MRLISFPPDVGGGTAAKSFAVLKNRCLRGVLPAVAALPVSDNETTTLDHGIVVMLGRRRTSVIGQDAE